MADFNGSHGLFISAFLAEGIPKRLWTLTIAFFCLRHCSQRKEKGGDWGYTLTGSKE